MGFFAPWFLAGLAAISAPVYFHLLRQHKSNPRPFSSLMFFERTTQSSIKHRRLRYLSLLALRVGILALLALAFAAPYIMFTSNLFTGGDKQVVIVVDNSFSMREGNRLEQAREEARAVLRGLGAGVEAQVATLGARLEFLTLPTTDRGELMAAVDAIGPGDARSSYGELARAIRAMSETARLPLEVHLASDVQKSSMPPSFTDLAMPSDVRFVIHPVADDLVPNFAVENVIAPASLFHPETATVQVTIAGYGTEATRHTVSLVANGKVLAAEAVEVPANGRVTHEFHSLEVPYGFNKCEVTIGSADELPEDDHFRFAVERSDPHQMLFISRRPRGRDLLYFRTAIESAANSAFRVQSLQFQQAGGLDPSRYAVVVLSDPGALPAGLEQNLKQYVRGGGAILVAAGPATARLDRVPVLDLPVTESVYSSRSGVRFRTAGQSDYSHPAIGVQDLWEGVKFYQAVLVEPGEARVLARLSDETPLLLERQVGEGRGLVFTSTFDNISNDLPLHPAFVAFVEQSTNYLGGIENRTSARPVDAFVDLRAGEGRAQGVELINPNGERALSLEEASAATSYQLAKVGFYELRRANNRNEMFAVNADRRESNLSVIPAETVDLWQGREETATAGEVVAEETRKPWNMWWYLLLLAFLVVVAESLLAAKYLSIDRGAA